MDALHWQIRNREDIRLYVLTDLLVSKFESCFGPLKVNSLVMLTAASKSFMFFVENSNYLVQHMFCNKLNTLLYTFSDTTTSSMAQTMTTAKSISTTGEENQSSQSLMLFILHRYNALTGFD